MEKQSIASLSMKRAALILAMLPALTASPAFAAQTARTGAVEKLQLDSKVIVGTEGRENLVWLLMPGPWDGTTCGSGWAYFNSKDDPHFMALVLTAHAQAQHLQLYVDDAYTKIGGYCRITFITTP
jgi:hypothetical protein